MFVAPFALGEHHAVPGVIACIQTSGALAHLHPHLHVLMSDGAFRRDGTFVPLPPPEPAVLEELWRRSVLAWFVRQGWLEDDEAAGMLAWPHSGFGAYVGPRIEDREGVLRVARYSARAPVAESRLRYHAERAEVELVSDASEGPYAGVHRFAALESRRLVHPRGCARALAGGSRGTVRVSGQDHATARSGSVPASLAGPVAPVSARRPGQLLALLACMAGGWAIRAPMERQGHGWKVRLTLSPDPSSMARGADR